MQAMEQPRDLGGELLSGSRSWPQGLEFGEAFSNVAIGEATHVVPAAREGLEHLTVFARQRIERPYRLAVAGAFALRDPVQGANGGGRVIHHGVLGPFLQKATLRNCP